MRRELNILETLFIIEHELDHADEAFEADARSDGFRALGAARHAVRILRTVLDHVYTIPGAE
jgi:hypothetical protein